MIATRWVVPLVLVGVVGAGVAAAAPQAGEHGMGSMRDTPLGRLVTGSIGRWMVFKSEANVTPEQRTKAHDVVKSHKAEIGDVVKDLVAKRRVLRDAVRSDKPDEAAIRKAGDDLGHSIGNAAVLASKVRGELKPVFTDKQVELFEKLVKDQDAAVDRWIQEAFSQ